MDAPSYQTVKRLFLEARDLDAEARRGYLDQNCAGDPRLREEVESLLRQGEGLDGFMARPAFAELELEGPHEPVSHPERIGAYRIVEPLGFGGMGVVYRARQDSPRRDVALKLLRLDSASPRQIERFEREIEVLGKLSHPCIARVYEAGWAETETGRRPFFAMELVEGRSLRDYANDRGLDVAAKIELVCRVAEAAHCAHERGIVHRDLKPSNVLVDERGEPKVLDFGVARSVSADSHATQTGQLVGTLAYMSPEQASGNGEVDARSDVYSLGAILYELLTDRLPTPTEGLALHEAVRRIQEEDPIAAGSVRRELKGDIETILSKALAKEPERRYASAADFSEDLRLFLDQRPIRARRPTSLYIGWKLVRRHRMLSASVLALFAATSLVQYFSVKLIQGRHQLERSEKLRRFYVEFGKRLLEEKSIEELNRRAEILKDYTAVPVLEEWVADARALTANLDARRKELDGLRSVRLENLDIPVPDSEAELFLDTLTDIVNMLEMLIGPRGNLPEIQARIESLTHAVPQDGGRKERP